MLQNNNKPHSIKKTLKPKACIIYVDLNFYMQKENIHYMLALLDRYFVHSVKWYPHNMKRFKSMADIAEESLTHMTLL